MSTNPFITSPLTCVIYDPIKNINRKTYVFLGDVPKNIYTAVSGYDRASARDRQQYDKLLKEFYGSDYRSKLALDIKNPTSAYLNWKEGAIEGGQCMSDDPSVEETEQYIDRLLRTTIVEDNNIEQPSQHQFVHPKTPAFAGGAVDDEIDLSDIEDLLKEEPKDKSEKTPSKQRLIDTISYDELKADFEPGVEYVRDVHVYPEDKFTELKEKIYLATNIPTYRQHLFHFNRNRIQTTYKLWADGLYKVDIRELPTFKDNVLSVPIDKYLYDIRGEVRIEAMDMFHILIESLNLDNVIYVVDLAQFTYKLHSQLMNIIDDTYYFELFYFGFVVKYWPQLTKECFYDYMRNEPELQHKYPDLAKNKQALEHIHKVEKEIIDYNYKHMIKAMSWAEHAGITIAITQMIATVSGNRVQLNIRNLFDKLRVTRCIPEIHAYIEHNGKRYLLRKRHIKNASDIQFPSGSLMKNGITLAISLRKTDQDNFHAKSSISTMENEQSRYLFLNIWPNGKYYIRTVWNEEDELGFEDIIRVMKRFTDPIINGINALGRYVFINGTSLPPISKQNINYQGLNICVFWKKVLLESTFKLIKTLWDPYMKARITGPRNVQQFDRYEYVFRKGMYDFDTTVIERIVTASNNIILNNYYAYLSNNAIKQKWDQNYDGRIVRMSHRTTAIRFEVSDIREKEFLLFFRYIVLFVYSAANDARVKQALVSTKTYENVKKLRKLREQDPELYNLKKHGSKKVYSILCQNQRQPLIYTQDEIKNLSNSEMKRLTQYWNFTLNKPAFYGCPNRKYPHLSFTVDAHPKHYCLPCCSKALSNEESKKTRVTSICLAKHKHPLVESAVEGPSSRHVMNYGKDIDVGRLSKLPNSAVKNLLYNTLYNSRQNYYLYGVAQHIPAINHIGIVYAVAEALETSVESLMKRLIFELKKATGTNLFSVLINGQLIEYFRNMDDLIVTIKEFFIDLKMISREYHKFKQWPELFTELFHIMFKVSVLTFIDESGSGESIDLYVPDILRSEISYVSKVSAAEGIDIVDTPGSVRNTSLVSSMMAEQKYVLIVKKQNRYYPIFVIDAEKYFKTFDVDQRYYRYGDNVIKLIYSMVMFDERHDKMQIDQRINLGLIKEFTIKNTEFKIVHKYVNKQNLCYAVLINASREGQPEYIYMPVDYSVHISDNIPINFDPFDRQKITLEYNVLMHFIDQFNKFIDAYYRIGHMFAYKKISIKDYVAIPVGSISGSEPSQQIIGFNTQDNLIYYFNKYNPEELDPSIKIRNIHYDYNEINRLIINRTEPIEDNRTRLLGESLYNNYIYQLFVIEFINYLDRERNQEVRAKIRSLVEGTNFRKDIAPFQRDIRALLKDYPNDNAIIQQQLIVFYYSHFNKTEFFERVNSTVYEFDRVTLNKLKKLPRDEMKHELKEIAKTFSVQKDFDTTGIKFPNIYLPCVDMSDDTGYCDKNKLMINKNIDDLVDILANDIMDGLKAKYLLTALFGDNLIDPLQFTQWSTEIVTVYKLSE